MLPRSRPRPRAGRAHPPPSFASSLWSRRFVSLPPSMPTRPSASATGPSQPRAPPHPRLTPEAATRSCRVAFVCHSWGVFMFSVRAATFAAFAALGLIPRISQSPGYAVCGPFGGTIGGNHKSAAHHRQRRPRLRPREARCQYDRSHARADPGHAGDRCRPDREPYSRCLAARRSRPASSTRRHSRSTSAASVPPRPSTRW